MKNKSKKLMLVVSASIALIVVALLTDLPLLDGAAVWVLYLVEKHAIAYLIVVQFNWNSLTNGMKVDCLSRLQSDLAVNYAVIGIVFAFALSPLGNAWMLVFLTGSTIWGVIDSFKKAYQDEVRHFAFRLGDLKHSHRY